MIEHIKHIDIMAISNRQRISMAIIVIAGLIGTGAVLLSGREKAEGAEAGHSQPDHDEDKAHEVEQATEKATEKASEKAAAQAGEHADRTVRLTDAQLKSSAIEVRTAGAATLSDAVRFQGEIRFDEDRTAHIVPRLAGVAELVPADLGQVVRKGDVLAVIASTTLSDQRSELSTARRRLELAKSTYAREKTLWQEKISAEQDYLQAQSALQEADIAVRNAGQKLSAVGASLESRRLDRFEIRAPFAGTVVEKHLSLGEAVKEDASIFTVTDLDSVWAEFAVAPKDLANVRVGQRAVVSSTAFEGSAEGRIAYVGALLGQQTRTARARVTLTNPQGAWRPGLFVTVSVLGEDRGVPLAVDAEALQTIDDQPMVFMAAPGGFVARPVKVGRNDGRTAEIIDGMKPGDRYAASGTFVLKSELGKAGAEHGH